VQHTLFSLRKPKQLAKAKQVFLEGIWKYKLFYLTFPHSSISSHKDCVTASNCENLKSQDSKIKDY